MSAKGYRRPVRWQYYYVCRFLNANGPKTAGDVGAFVWRNKKRVQVKVTLLKRTLQ